ncbi:ATP-dependent DEAD/H RNA helicase [Nematocida parisii ERTm1]|uniref:ATP-dependent DEAD/H RNA helicase n=1 Tax=Nematocida parisii (strain ERTm1 / ATCC PRA-289) TaxID=881290 RepID=UPI000264B429|nr:ATP-dependent DEAD/H RNA helicase [Nematocida parisii ERTm1]EIJ94120.1 ATP-dependent DEAD/H RNA helicase [Nematocida parisii ERTm1]KAI5143378.1 antiviral helicase SKI2 [Nematocida parisii]KAI5156302.1 antiviral helicase SKI2 [Nematocida parisii]|eukprot:XP_013058616.1 ATP-dependent DEAD/H RNA helicase [Nematocida parisii ERTm1]
MNTLNRNELKMLASRTIATVEIPPLTRPWFTEEYEITNTKPEENLEIKQEEVSGVIVIKNNKIPLDYSKCTPDYPHISFEPDNFQKQCFYYINKSQSIFVTAHTSSGKTLIAEYASYIAELHDTRMIYTSPIKALSNQKYREFSQKFSSVGILTGDAQINSTAKCLVMTTEILRNMLYRGSTILDDVEFIVFDEIHYLGDKERGVVWEEVIIMLPRHISLIFLSATSPNAKDMCGWISTIKNKEMYLIGTEKRAVELEHGIYFRKELYMLTQNHKFNQEEYLKAKNKGAVEIFKEKQRTIPALQKKTVEAKKKAPTILETPIHIARDLIQRNLAPIVFFDFSKSRIEQSFSMCDSLDLTTAEEKSLIRGFISDALLKLPKADRALPQITFVIPSLIRGVGMHHSGLLPILKEIIEMLFTTGALRVLFSTETLAMGLNMPARTVVIRTTKKYSPETRSYVDISVGEYTQMAGRAGRRGYDIKGTSIIECSGQEILPESLLVKLQTGTSMAIESNFYITARMILKLLRVKSVSIEEMVRFSFGKSKIEQKIRKLIHHQIALKTELLHSVMSCEQCTDALVYVEKYQKALGHLEEVYKSIQLPKTHNYTIVQTELKKILSTTPHYMIEAVQREAPENESIQDIRPILVLDKESKKPAAIPTKDFKLHKAQSDAIAEWNYLEGFKCLQCSNFLDHYPGYLKEYLLRSEIENIDRQFASTNTSGLKCNNYFNYIIFLRTLGYIDGLNNITLKGKIAYEFNSIECVLTTEVLLSPQIANMKTHELIIGLVGLTFFEKHQLKEEAEHPREEPRTEQIKILMPSLLIINEIVSELKPVYRAYRIKMENPNHAFCGELALWLNDKTLAEIIDASPLSEGVIVKYIRKATEICTELIIAARILGNPRLSQEVEAVNEKLKRGIVFTPSLYYG